MSFLLDDISVIIGVFDKYATRTEGSPKLTRQGVKELIQKELADVIEEPRDPKALTLQLLDINGDSLVDFDEYLLLIFRVAKACSNHLQPREGICQEEDAWKTKDHHSRPCAPEPVDDYDQSHPLPRAGHRRYQLRDPEREQRSQIHELESRGRSPSRGVDRREDGWARQQLPHSQSREDESLRERERGRPQPRGQEQRTGLSRREPATRAKMESQQRSWNTEPREQDKSWLHPGECDRSESETQSCEPEPREDHRRRPQTLLPRKGDWRRQQYYEAEHLESEGERRCLQQRDHRGLERGASRSRAPRYRPTEREQDGSFPSKRHPREDDQSRQQTYEPEPRETKRRTCRAFGSDDGDGEQKRFEPEWREGEHRRTQQRGPELRENEWTRRWYCEDELDREQRRSQPLDSDSRDGEPRRVWKRDGYLRDGGQRRTHKQDSDSTDGDQRRTQEWDAECTQQWNSNSRDGNQKGTHKWDYDFGVGEQRRTYQWDSDSSDSDQKWTQQWEGDLRDGEQRRTQQQDSDPRDGDQRRTQQSDPEFQDKEKRRTKQRGDDSTAGDQRRNQQWDSESRDGDHRRTWEVDSGLQDGKQRRPLQQDDVQRTVQQRDSESQGKEQRRTQQWDSNSRDGDQMRTRQRESGPRESWEDRRTPQCVSDSRDGVKSRTHQHGPKERRPHRCGSNLRDVEWRRPQRRDAELQDSEQPRRTWQWDFDPANAEQQKELEQEGADPGNRGEERRTNRGVPHPTGYEQQRRTQECGSITSGQQICPSVFGEGEQCRETSETRESVQPGRGEPGSQVTDSVRVQSPETGPQGGDMTINHCCDLDPRKGGPWKPQSSQDKVADGGLQQRGSVESQQRENERGRPQPHEPERTGGGQDKAHLLAVGLKQAECGSQRGPELRGDQRRRGPVPQERERRRQQTQDPLSIPGSSQATGGPRSGPQSRQNNPASRLQEASQTHRPPEREGTPERFATTEPRQPPALSISQEGGGGRPTPTEEGSGSSPRVREPQPLLGAESSPGPETPVHVGKSEGRPDTGEPDATKGKPGVLCENKTAQVCNPLYEYLLAQKKLEEP